MSSVPAFKDFKRSVREAVEVRLERAFDAQPPCAARNAARYATLGGGHRWRALVVAAVGRLFRDDALEFVLDGACALEMAHAASLVLDDLPCMDNARIRRGKPCAHLAFPEWVIAMTPAYLVNSAYSLLLADERPSVAARMRTALALGAVGCAMADGQERDLMPSEGHEDRDQRLLRCYRNKSAALYGVAARAGALLAGADVAAAERLCACGEDIGLSYQFQDDIADVVAAESQTGKTMGLDAGKPTSVALWGLKETKRRARAYRDSALSRIADRGPEADLLRGLILQANGTAV